MKKHLFAHWQGNFWAGLAIVFPAFVSIAVLQWLFGTVANITDTLLFAVPQEITHRDHGNGPMHWYWSLVALVFALFLICCVGVLARNYFGRKMIMWVDAALMRVPLLNKIYGTAKQVNDTFSSNNKTAFRTVVMVEFPQAGTYTIGFIASEPPAETEARLSRQLISVFVPATPNPTSGFLLLVPAEKVVRLDMTVAEGFKYLLSLGSIAPAGRPAAAAAIRNP